MCFHCEYAQTRSETTVLIILFIIYKKPGVWLINSYNKVMIFDVFTNKGQLRKIYCVCVSTF